MYMKIDIDFTREELSLIFDALFEYTNNCSGMTKYEVIDLSLKYKDWYEYHVKDD